MGKIKIIFLLSLLFSIGSKAEPCVVVATSNGESVFFFNEKPSFTYDGQKVQFTTSTTHIEYSPSNILSVKIEDRINTSIDDISNNKGNISYSLNDKGLTINGCNLNEKISLYSVNGTLMAEEQAKNNTVNFTISQLPTGIYIIQSKTSAIKIIKK